MHEQSVEMMLLPGMHMINIRRFMFLPVSRLRFSMMDDGDGEITLDDFLHGARQSGFVHVANLVADVCRHGAAMWLQLG